ncbi:MAG: M56 family metallopeptidase [Candidatus Methanofastidiosia archaeon]
MCSGESLGNQEVDTSRVALLGFALVSIIVFAFPTGYVFVHAAIDFQMHLPGISRVTAELVRGEKIIGICMFILPQPIFLVIWYGMPSFVKKWYNLAPLPSEYRHIHSLTERIASLMDIPVPDILYTSKDVPNCFNIGRRDKDSAIVLSKWLFTNLDIQEFEAVLTHEMAHTKNRDVTLMAYFVAVQQGVLLVPFLFLIGIIYFVLEAGFSLEIIFHVALLWILVIFLFLVYAFLTLGILWFSRLREAAADTRVSLFVDKEALKRALYKMACGQSVQMLLVFPSLRISTTGGVGGILSTHPPISKRFQILENQKYVINLDRPPSLRFCFTSAIGLFIFSQLVTSILSTPYFLTVKQIPPNVPFIFLGPIMIALLLSVYYDYVPLRHLGVIVLFITFLQVAIFFSSTILYYYYAKTVFLSSSEIFSPEYETVATSVIREVQDLREMILEILEYRIYFFVITFLFLAPLRYVRKRKNT